MQQKSNNFTSAKERILQYLDFKGVSQYQFSKETGLSNGFLKSGSSVSSDNLKLLSSVYLDLNLLWVITGKGDMILLDKNAPPEKEQNLHLQKSTLHPQLAPPEDKKETPDKPILKKPQNPKQKPQIETPIAENAPPITDDLLHPQNLNLHPHFAPPIDKKESLIVPIVGKSFERRVERQEVPLYDFDAVAGLTPVFNGQGNPVDYISIPNLAKVDGAVHVCGDSMYPLLKSGDIVMYKIVNDLTNIIWGEMYLISISYDDDEYISVKYLRKSENSQKSVILASYNPNHAPKEIPIECIRSLALIKAVIHFNVM